MLLPVTEQPHYTGWRNVHFIPDEMLGRASGVFRLFGFGALSLGAALADIFAEIFGISAVFALCAALTLFLLIPFYPDITPALTTTTSP